MGSDDDDDDGCGMWHVAQLSTADQSVCSKHSTTQLFRLLADARIRAQQIYNQKPLLLLLLDFNSQSQSKISFEYMCCTLL